MDLDENTPPVENENTPDSAISEESDQILNEPQIKKRKEDSKRLKNSKLRMQGDNYFGFETKTKECFKQKKARKGKEIKPVCGSAACSKNPQRHCNTITEESREYCFNKFWKTMNWKEKHSYIASLMVANEPKQRITEDLSRKFSFSYFLEFEGKQFQVCRTTFIHTFNISCWQAHNWKLNSIKRNERAAAVKQEKKKSAGRATAETFLKSLPKLPSHYCRSTSNKEYLYDEIPNKSSLYKLFVKYCTENGVNAPGRNVLAREFKNQNLAFFQPKKDRCDTCVSHEAGHIDENVYNTHLAKKEAARSEKNRDKTDGNDHHSVWTMDVQAVLISPKLNASALYYKTKLASHNFTMYNIKTGETKCYVWDETEADLSSHVFTSCIRLALSEVLDKDPETEKITLFSDGCGYQNRNSVLSNMLLDFSVTHNVVIQQKFLERGHTQMECDSIHSAIERRVKNRTIYWPEDYVTVMKECRPENPFTVIEMSSDKFLNFSGISYLKSIRPGKKYGEPQVHDLRALQYTNDGEVLFKTHHDDEFQPLPQRVMKPNQPYEMTKLFHQRLKIKKSKYDHLQQLKAVIPSVYHSFYDSIPY